MLGFKLIHVSKLGPWCQIKLFVLLEENIARKFTIPVFGVILQSFAIPGYFPNILFYRYILYLLSSGCFLIAVCGSISVRELEKKKKITITIVDSLWCHNENCCYANMRSQRQASCLLTLEFKCHLRYCSSQEVDVSLSHSAVLHYISVRELVK